MITANGIYKSYDGKTDVLKGVELNVPGGTVVGVIGENGAGKSTLLRILAGVYRPDRGTVTLGGVSASDKKARRDSVLVADELYFLPTATIRRMAKLYASVYPRFDNAYLTARCAEFGLSMTAPIRSFSKGMKRQAALLLALACNTQYLFIDETFDGIDPFKREAIRKLLSDRVKETGLTALISGHSLRELEGTCERILLLWNGVLQKEGEQKAFETRAHKYQAVFKAPFDEALFEPLAPLSVTSEGSVARVISDLGPAEALPLLESLGAVIAEELPLKLEEMFLYGRGAETAGPTPARESGTTPAPDGDKTDGGDNL